MSVVEDEIIDFFKKEIESKNISQRLVAVRNCEYVADSLCCASVKNVLLPLINDMIDPNQSDEVLCCIADTLPKLCQYLGDTFERFCFIIPFYYRLLSHEDSIVRHSAQTSFCRILLDVESLQEEDKCYVLEKMSSLLITLGHETNDVSRTSACLLSCHLHKKGTCDIQKKMLQLFQKLCYEQVPLIQKSASVSLLEFTKNVDPKLYDSFIMPTILHFWNHGWGEDVRVKALYSCITLTQHLPNDLKKSFSHPLLLQAVEEGTWQTRRAIAENLDNVLKYLDPCNIAFEKCVCSLLKDLEPKIVILALESLDRAIQNGALNACLDTSVINELENLTRHSNAMVKSLLANIVIPLYEHLKNHHVKNQFLTIVNVLLQDTDAHVKLSVLQHGKRLLELFGMNNIGGNVRKSISNLLCDSNRCIRLKMLQQLVDLASAFKNKEFQKNIERLYYPTFEDTSYTIRETAAHLIQGFGRLLGADWVKTSLVHQLLKLYSTEVNHKTSQISGRITETIDFNETCYVTPPSYHIRVTVLQCFPGTIPFLDNTTKQIVMDMLKKALQDPIINVRITVVHVIAQIRKCSLSLPASFYRLVETLSTSDADTDVRYFSQQAVQSFSFQNQTQ
ncbi:serine/threonine-protein phosphatase PP2A 65 kDa regulatory subunit-like isoform X2 [Hylaeus volcanicus]|uniref:serine/threonine-protein phosphatase PP2A 65 kDa regulatory subunit-like isoform X2 n=1 Tax=Hylaeus volcanicus TaxID=313075 RepID=UPI0023B79B02|nr:serine/threonine-protein phosphatase PP2A 65 kDa regulatory subunit-like isoform X2 [Hylaeus volcanicus]